jgi:terminase small subunit / prophage DNA-packing protein
MATQNEVAQHLFISQQRVAQLIDKQVLPDADRGSHDIDACREAFIRHLQEIASGDDKALASERTRLAREQADSIALANAERRNELLPRSEIVAAWQGLIASCRAKLLAIPTRMAPQIANLKKPAVVKEKLTTAIHEALDELGKTSVAPVPGAGDIADDSDGSDRGDEGLVAAAAADGEPVVRSKTRAQPRGQRRAR